MRRIDIVCNFLSSGIYSILLFSWGIQITEAQGIHGKLIKEMKW